MRRDVHGRVSRSYRRENCDTDGNQESNLTEQERRGLRSLEKRKSKGEIIIIQTDKSSKLCIMTREDYLKLGEDHVGKDEIIERDEILKIEKKLNEHALAWCKMWRTDEAHGHEDRIRQSKVTNSENRADLYLTYKDHKKEPGKTRPIATGCSSNTLGLSNSLSTFLESVANAEMNKLEVISSEDMLFHTKEHNKKIRE